MSLNRQVNSYLAILFITVVGSAAALIIVRFAFATSYTLVLVNGATGYASILQ